MKRWQNVLLFILAFAIGVLWVDKAYAQGVAAFVTLWQGNAAVSSTNPLWINNL